MPPSKILKEHSNQTGSLYLLLLEKKQHETQVNPQRVVFLDGWRGLAISLVLISHFLPVKHIDMGRLGVDVFFVLSGMLMSNLLFVKRVKLSTFYKRRISRIIPVFVLFVSSVYLASYILGDYQESSNYLYTLFFMRSYVPGPHIWLSGMPIGHLWSLNVEEHCYIILSLLTLLSFLKNKGYIPILMIGAGSVLLNYLYFKYPSYSTNHYDVKTEIVASHLMLSAGYFLIKDRVARFIPVGAPLVTLLLSIMCYLNEAPWYASWLISPFLLAFTVNHLNLMPKAIKTILEFKPLCMLGTWAFSIYLWQQPLYFFGVKNGSAFYLAGPVLLIASILIGKFSFHFFEEPARKYINNKW